MAVTIKHAKTDTIADWTQSDLDAQIAAGNYPAGTVLADIVLPSDWNNDHTVTGLGTMATQDANNVSITGGSISGATVSGYIPTTQKGAANGVATLDAGGKVPTSQIPALGDLNYQGTWDASTNTPTLTSSVGTKGYYYVVNVAGSTNLNGITDWQVGDWAVFNGTVWEKLDNTQAYPAAGIANSTGSAWGTSYSTTGSGTVVALQNSPSLTSPTIDGANPYIQFSNGSSVTLAAGRLWYDGSTGSWNAGMGGGNITQQIGEEIFVYGRASAAISEGQVVAVTGSYGTTGVVTFAPAPAGLTDDTVIVGIATEPIANNAFGRVTAFGTVHGLSTSPGFADGDVLWYDPTTVGGYTKTKPTAPNVKCQVGIITKAAGGTNGSIAVDIIHGTALGGTDSNVNIATPTNGQILTYDTSNTYWKNTSLTAGTGISVSAATGGTLTVTNSAPDQTVAISGTSPVSVTGTYPNFTVSMTQASTSTNGWLSSTDWNTFNNKGSGTVTSVSAVAPITSSGGATPIISMAAATGSVSGYLTSTDWTTFNSKQTAYTNLSTFGALANSAGWLYNNGTGTLSYSTPTAAQVGAVPTTRSLTINGTAYDLSADRTWSVGTVTSVAALTLGTSGTDLSSTVATGTTTPVITLNVPTASATNRGALSAADWTTFNNKGSGSVTTVSVASANGFAGTVANASTTPAITLTTSISGMLKGNGTAISAGTAGTDYVAPGTATTFTATQTFNGSSSTLAAIFANAAETTTVSATAATGTINYDVTTQSVLYYTTNASANFTMNFRGSSGTSLNTAMATGQTVTVVFLCTNGATAYYNNAVTIDGNSVTPKYQGGSAWTSGNASSIDAYTFTIIKTGSAAFTVLTSLTQFK